jgi:hypothetical protein
LKKKLHGKSITSVFGHPVIVSVSLLAMALFDDRELEAALAASLLTASLDDEMRQALAASEQSAARDEQSRQDEAVAHRLAVDEEEDEALAAALAASLADVPSTSEAVPVPRVEVDPLLDFAIALSLDEWEAPSTSAAVPALAAAQAAERRMKSGRQQLPRHARVFGDVVVTAEDRRQAQILADWR